MWACAWVLVCVFGGGEDGDGKCKAGSPGVTCLEPQHRTALVSSAALALPSMLVGPVWFGPPTLHPTPTGVESTACVASHTITYNHRRLRKVVVCTLEAGCPRRWRRLLRVLRPLCVLRWMRCARARRQPRRATRSRARCAPEAGLGTNARGSVVWLLLLCVYYSSVPLCICSSNRAVTVAQLVANPLQPCFCFPLTLPPLPKRPALTHGPC